MTERSATTPSKASASDDTNPRLRLGNALRAKLAPGESGSSKASRRPRRARLRLTRIDPWSVMKTSFLLSVAFGVVTFVAVLVVWSVLSAAGLWDSINDAVGSVLGGEGEDFDINDYIGAGRVLGFTLVVSVLDVILLTAISTLVAFVYNLSAALLGGIEVTLAEEDR